MTKKIYKKIQGCTFGFLILSSSASMAVHLTSADAINVVLGSDYFHTTSGANWPGLGNLFSRANGLDAIRPQYAPLPNTVDTIIERQDDCNIASLGGSCTIDIEMVGLSLQTAGGVFVRQDIDRASTGTMTINYLTLDAINDVVGGTFSSSLEVFFEYSIDGGANWFDMETPNGTYLGTASEILNATSIWSSEPGGIFTGLVGDQDADYHTDKNIDLLTGPIEFDFYTGTTGIVDHSGIHPVKSYIPIAPTSLLFGLGLLGTLGFRKKK